MMTYVSETTWSTARDFACIRQQVDGKPIAVTALKKRSVILQHENRVIFYRAIRLPIIRPNKIAEVEWKHPGGKAVSSG